MTALDPAAPPPAPPPASSPALPVPFAVQDIPRPASGDRRQIPRYTDRETICGTCETRITNNGRYISLSVTRAPCPECGAQRYQRQSLPAWADPCADPPPQPDRPDPGWAAVVCDISQLLDASEQAALDSRLDGIDGIDSIDSIDGIDGLDGRLGWQQGHLW